MNPLASFSLEDVLELRERVDKEKAARQGQHIVDKVKEVMENNIKDPGWMPLYPFMLSDHIYGENVEHLVSQGFKVWRCTFGGTPIVKHYISWSLDTFDQVFASEVAKHKFDVDSCSVCELLSKKKA